MVSSFLPKNERWYNFHYIKLSQRSFYGRIEDTINCFRDLLTFNNQEISKYLFLTLIYSSGIQKSLKKTKGEKMYQI